MSDDKQELSGPDLTQGVDASDVTDNKMVLGHAHGEPVLLARRGAEVFAVGAKCTHYGGPLAEGLSEGGTVRCPWHHACFSLRTGEALSAPALKPVACWKVEQRDEKLFVIGKSKEPKAAPPAVTTPLFAVVIVGGGAAGQAAAEMLRREGYSGKLTLLSADSAPPCDRPNLSKDYLAGNAEEDWIPLQPPEFFEEHNIDLVLNTRVKSLDVTNKSLTTEAHKVYPYDALLLATGAEPVKLNIPGNDLPHVHTLRTVADCQAIIASLGTARRAVILGASFIGLEVAASLRARQLEVHVVAPEARPLERVLGPQLGDFLRALHEEHGVNFHLGQKAKSIEAGTVTLEDGTTLPADLVVVGVGVRPMLALAEDAGLASDGGVIVNEYLETSAPGVFAAGDIARWPDPHSGELIRIEHWVVAQRHGQIAARNILGHKEPCTIVPFFWSRHYDVGISYVGHASQWDHIELTGSIAEQDCRLDFQRAGKTLAVVTLGRDVESLQAEVAFEKSLH